jgi:hypothetical protein
LPISELAHTTRKRTRALHQCVSYTGKAVRFQLSTSTDRQTKINSRSDGDLIVVGAYRKDALLAGPDVVGVVAAASASGAGALHLRERAETRAVTRTRGGTDVKSGVVHTAGATGGDRREL